jgi:hypothetical protein|tara:strand:+ start:790 stop:978 length:189 start_codon:yes stop_codon:yes gene_type:complete
MRNRNLLNRKLDALDATLTNLKRIVNTQEPLETYKANISKASTIVEEIKGMIEMEPMDHTGN